MEPIKIEQDTIKKAIQSGHSYIQVGKRKFLLMEVENVSNDGRCFEVTDPEEEKQLVKAINENNPVLTEEEIKQILKIND